MEWKDFDSDRDRVIEDCRKAGLKGIVSSCARLGDLEKSLAIKQKHDGFVFLTVGLHPEFIKDITEKDIEAFMDWGKEHRNEIVGIGEIGLDYHWVTEEQDQKRQREMFVRLIEFAREVKKPIVVHSRQASEDTIKILEDAGMRTQWHFLTDRKVMPSVLENGWMVSINTLILRSKDVRKIARDLPMDKLLLETDAPWLGPEGERNTPMAIRQVAEKIAEMKKISFDPVWKAGFENAVKFFGLEI